MWACHPLRGIAEVRCICQHRSIAVNAKPKNATKPDALRIAVVEDLRDTRESLAFLINETEDMTCVIAVGSAEEALELLSEAEPHLVLLDIQLAGGMDGIDCLAKLKARNPSAQVVMLTGNSNPDIVFSCLIRGATGYLQKSIPPARLPDAIRDAASGGSPMSPEIARLVTAYFQRFAPANREWERLSLREQDVVALLAKGFLKKEIADQLGISEDTVRSHCRRIYEKLHVNSREQAVAKVVSVDALPKKKSLSAAHSKSKG